MKWKDTTSKMALKDRLFLGNQPAARTQRWLYASDASVYQELPEGVAMPHNTQEIKELIQLAISKGTSLLPRAGGTSLAGQVVGSGIVVDIGTHMHQVVELNTTQKWVRVQPGIIRNDLNAFLQPHGLLFGPETSTASRAMIGGMIGNNSCGLHSIIWGDTRSQLLELDALLADGSLVQFGPISKAVFEQKCAQNNLEGKIYYAVNELLSSNTNQTAIAEGFPRPDITRRNTGYALDALLASWLHMQAGGTFNMCPIIAGSEGTLCFVTEAKLQLENLPPPEVVLVNIHCNSFVEAAEANIIAMRHQPSASEFLDQLSIELTEGNAAFTQYRDWVLGRPKAILMVEFFGQNKEEIDQKTAGLLAEIKAAELGYNYVILHNQDTHKAWELRKGSLGILSNQPGDTGPVNLIEDCAVVPADLPAYITEIEALLHKYKLDYSIAGHAGAGELHVCPMMNVRTPEGKELFRQILVETVPIIKKYKGSLSGEHGDGRLRGEFIAAVMGPECYALFKQIKAVFDPKGLFNKGKITDTPAMHTNMRVQRQEEPKAIATTLQFDTPGGILRLAEKCSGSGDCRKSHITGGTMCPSFMATRQEQDSTRGRANMLRHYYTAVATLDTETEINSLQQDTKAVLDLCLSCKGCKTECPSSVDLSKMKAEFTQNYMAQHGTGLRSRIVGNFSSIMRFASVLPGPYNYIFGSPTLRRIANRLVGFHPERSMPHLASQTLKAWYSQHIATGRAKKSSKKILLFCDEFTNYNDATIGQKAILLLETLGYEVLIPKHGESGRSYLSKGFVKKAQAIANKNIVLLKDLVTAQTPLIGLEPSALLGFRDEYLDLAYPENKAAAKYLAQNSFLFEEWLASENDKGNIDKNLFTNQKRLIKLHGHCHQKALSNIVTAKKALSIPAQYEVQLIPSGCCGMAGSFGYEAEHYNLSQQIGELVLLPTVRQQPANVIIAAAGTSCRHQILDGTSRNAQHPAEILYDALLNKH
jgi:FAD/FMN-containing dehydrogenase/Fe-S oxidoreductase